MTASDPVDRVLQTLSGAKPNGAGWQARCPAHEDAHASLSVSIGDDGRVLLHCHAGCATRVIVAAIGLTMRDLFPDRGSREPEASYDYRDEKRDLLFQVVRFAGKQFRQRRPDGAGGWVWSLDGVRRVLYRLPDLKGRAAIFITEGEKDAEGLWQIGLAATTNPHGAGKWRDEYASQLKEAGCQRVAILPDNDPPGDAHARTVARSLQTVGLFVKIVPLADVPPKGDVSDYLQTHSRQDLLEAAKIAPPFKPQQLRAAPLPVALTSLADLLAEPDDAIDWLVEDRIPAGALVLLAGKPKAGKSTLARDLAFAVATGQPWLGWRAQFGRVWYVVLEEKRGEIRKAFRRMGATGSEPIRFLIEQASADLLARLHELARQEKPALIVVDTLQRLIQAKDLNDYAHVTERLNPVLALSRETGATLFLLHHASAHAGREGLDAVLGSTALSASVDNVLILTRSERHRELSSVQRIGPDLEPMILALDERSGRVQVAGRKRDVDDAEIADRIVQVLRGQAEPVTEAWIRQHVEGRLTDQVRVLRQLLGRRHVRRTGGGARGNPYKYQIEDTHSRESSNKSTDTANGERELSVASKEDRLDFGILVPEVPLRKYGNESLNNDVTNPTPATSTNSGSHVPETLDKSKSSEAEIEETPNKTGVNSRSREPEFSTTTGVTAQELAEIAGDYERL